MKIRNLVIPILALILLTDIVSASMNVSLADHGSNIRNKTSGEILSSADLRVEIYDAANGGNLIYNETFSSAIYNGSWNIMLGENSSNPLSLEFGRKYYKDYLINGENVNFTNLTGNSVDRQFFYSPLGDVNVSYIVNSSWINWAAAINGSLLSGSNTTYAYSLNNSLWSTNYSNISVGWLYALNNSLWTGNYSNFTNIYSYAINDTNYNSSSLIKDWNNSGFIKDWNADGYIKDWNATGLIKTWLASESDTLWTGNYSNFTGVYANQITNASVYNYATNGSGWLANYSNYTTGWLYAVNSTGTSTGGDETLWNANYSDYLNKPTYAQTANGTILMRFSDWNATNTSYMPFNTSVVGNFSFNGGWQNDGVSIIDGSLYAQTIYVYNVTSLNVSQQNLSVIENFRAFGNAQFDKNITADTNVLLVDSNTNRVGILTTTPQNAFNVIGTGNFTEDIFSKERNLSVGYDYAINSTGGSEDLWNANYSNMSIGWLYAINSTGSGADTFSGNYSNFTFIYGYAINDTNYNSSGLIKNWNADSYIKDWNSTGFIKDWNATGLIKTWLSSESEPY